MVPVFKPFNGAQKHVYAVVLHNEIRSVVRSATSLLSASRASLVQIAHHAQAATGWLERLPVALNFSLQIELPFWRRGGIVLNFWGFCEESEPMAIKFISENFIQQSECVRRSRSTQKLRSLTI
eukprot:6285366-Amphidinium_carterae.1